MPGDGGAETDARREKPTFEEGAIVGEAEVPAVVLAYFEALNGEDWERLADLWTEAAELQAVGVRARTGRDDVLAYFRPLFDPWAHHFDRPTRYIVSDTVVVVEVEFTGTTRTGRELSFDALDVFDLAGDAIARLTTWYDLVWVRKKL